MEFLSKELNKYIEDHSEPESKLLGDLNRQTHIRELLPQMLSGHIQGLMLKMFSRMVSPRRILEIGTFTGYSAICLAEGLSDDGKLHTIEIEEERREMIEKYFGLSDHSEKLELHIGNARDIIPQLEETFDLVFIDADKTGYSEYFNLILPKLSMGGFIITDNVLWSGRVIEENKDRDTEAIDQYNKMITNDDRVENILLPVRDGIMIARKIA